MMTRTQLSFEHDMLRDARERARQMGVSLAEYVRRLVSADLQGTQRSVDPGVVFDLGCSGGADVARDKDRMLAEAFAEPRR